MSEYAAILRWQTAIADKGSCSSRTPSFILYDIYIFGVKFWVDLAKV